MQLSNVRFLPSPPEMATLVATLCRFLFEESILEDTKVEGDPFLSNLCWLLLEELVVFE